MKDFTIVEELDIHGNNRWRCNICGEVFNKMGTAPHLGGHRRAVERVAVKNSSAITPVQQLKAKIRAIVAETVEAQNGNVDAGELPQALGAIWQIKTRIL